MRVLWIALIVTASLAQAHAEEPTAPKPDAIGSSPCHYALSGEKTVEISIGANACFRDPAPFIDTYALLRCEPPLAEVEHVKRGDTRCDKTYGD
jgi:hypothetical protein